MYLQLSNMEYDENRQDAYDALEMNNRIVTKARILREKAEVFHQLEAAGPIDGENNIKKQEEKEKRLNEAYGMIRGKADISSQKGTVAKSGGVNPAADKKPNLPGI